MRTQCIQAVEQAIGRALKAPEVQDIETRIRRNLRSLAAEDPAAFAGMSPGRRLQEAAARAGQEVQAEHALKQRRIALTVQAHDRVKATLAQRPGQGLDGLDALIAKRTDGKWSAQSVESRTGAIRNLYLSGMQAVTDYLAPRRLGTYLDAERVRAFLREVWGENTGDAEAKAAAQNWKDSAEQMRVRFNDSGGDIHHLDDWGVPQHHSQLKVAKAGEQAWVDSILPLLDRSRYFNEDGTPMTDAQMRATLSEVHQTIATGGLNKLEPGKPSGRGMRANRHGESRWLHFKSADDWLQYQERFGDQPVPAILVGHVEGLAKDIALTETFGPNPDLQYRYWRDKALSDGAKAAPEKTGSLEQEAKRVDGLYDFVAGKNGGVAHAGMARAFDTLRSWMVATRLGSAVITSLTDEGTMRLTAAVNNLEQVKLFRNQLATLNPANRVEKRLAQRAGLAIDTMLHSMNRWGAESLAPNVASRVADVVMRASGLNAITDARRRAFGVTMMDAIGRLVKEKNFAQLDPTDARILLSKGFTDADWQVLKQAQPQQWGSGKTILTPQAVMDIPGIPQKQKLDVATKLLGTILDETNVAIPEPGARARKIANVAGARGTLGGELWRSILLFKTFPIAMIQMHWARAMGMSAKGKVGYLAALVASTTVMGALAIQANEVISGRDPRNMADPKFWLAAFLKGGSLGIYGDFLFSQQSQGGQSAVAALGGPLLGAVEEAVNLTQGNLVQAALGEETNFWPEAIKFAKGNIPAQNLWYTKAVTDHLIFQQLQEMANPGYLARVKRRAQREYGQEFYWAPGELTPDRAPDLSRAFVTE